MTSKKQDIFFADNDTFDKMCEAILTQISNNDAVMKITFFNNPGSNSQYIENLQTINTKIKERFNGEAPLIAYVAQPCATASMAAEVTYMPQCDSYERCDGYTILHYRNSCEIVTKGITAANPNDSIRKQSEEIFATLDAILSRHEFTISDIYRQWNYIEQITSIHNERQNYQEFNDARSRYYNRASWENGYPAATGIGTSFGGVMVEVCALKGETGNHPIDNPLQISAHSYSQKVLTGKSDEAERTTPKFERARLVGDMVYISGTAAIKGEESLSLDNAVAQTAETMQIIKHLTSAENLPGNKATEYTLLRTYIKNNNDAPEVIKYMEKNYPAVAKHYLIADVCRPELLIEIEGTAIVK